MCEPNPRKRGRDDHNDTDFGSKIENEKPSPSNHALAYSSENFRSADSNKRACTETNTGEDNATKDVKNDLPQAHMKKPRRPMSAYNLFFRDERAKILATTTDSPHDNRAESSHEDDQKPSTWKSYSESSKARKARKRPHGVISFGQLGKTIAARWKTIDADTLAKYTKVAAREKQLYREKVQEYNKNQDAILEHYRETCTANLADAPSGEEGTTVTSDIVASSRESLATSVIATANEEAEALRARINSQLLALLSTRSAWAKGASRQYIATDDECFDVGAPIFRPANAIDNALVSRANMHKAVDVPVRVGVPIDQPANIVDNAVILRANGYTFGDQGCHAYDGILGHDHRMSHGYPFVRPRSDSVIPQFSGAVVASPMLLSWARLYAPYPAHNLYHPVSISSAIALNQGISRANVASNQTAHRSNLDVYLPADRYDPALLDYRHIPR